MKDRFDTGSASAGMPRARKSARVKLNGQVALRRSAQRQYRVKIFDASPHGCKLEFVERPSLDERIWIKFDGLDSLEALVCWVDGFVTGVEFERPIHPAVFDLLIARMR